MKRKILHLISGLEVGGAEMQLLRILPKLQEYHEHRVCCVRGHGPIGPELEKNGVPVYYLYFKGLTDLKVIWRFYKIIKKFSPDILVTYLIHADLYGRVFGKLFGIKKIISSKRGVLLQWEWLATFDRITKCLVTHYLVQTQKAKEEWSERLHLFNEKKFTIIPNGIDTEQFNISINTRKKRESLFIPIDSLVITCVGRLRRKKGHEYLLEAFESIFKKNSNVILLLVGDGEREDELKKQITIYKSKNSIKFLGNRTDIPEILAITDIFILPTEGEGMSNAIIEAMISGRAIITTDIPENKELILNKETGLLVSVGSALAIELAINKLINEPVLRSYLGENAKKESKNRFDLQKIVQILSKFYLEI